MNTLETIKGLDIFKSSRRIAMILTVATACAGFLMGLIDSQLFMGLVTALVVYKAADKQSA
jgi:hypothetical protein